MRNFYPELNFIKPLKITVADQEPVIQLLVKSGVGLALMIEEEAMEAKSKGEISVWDTVIDTIDLSFVYPSRREKEPLIKAVLEGIHESEDPEEQHVSDDITRGREWAQRDQSTEQACPDREDEERSRSQVSALG